MIAWLAGNMLWASAAMLLVLAIRRPVARLFGAGIAYALWLIPVLRLVAPPAGWLASLWPDAIPALPPLFVMIDAAPDAALLPSADASGPWVPILLVLWAGGAALFIAAQAWSYRRFRARLTRAIRRTGSHDGLPLFESAAVDGPLALGLFDRRIVVPADFTARYSLAEQRLALAHEAYHHRRGDILANHIALAVLALNWFNPVAWLAFRAMRADQELSCDAAIAAAFPGAAADYGRALVKAASRPGLIAACPLNSADQLKRRLKMLNHHRRSRGRAAAGTALTAALVAGTLAFGTPVMAHDSLAQPAATPAPPAPAPTPDGTAPRQQRERIIIMDRRGPGEPPPAGASGNTEIRIRTNREGNIDDIRGDALPPELAERIDNCRNGATMLNVDQREAAPPSQTGERRTRVILCGEGANGGGPSVEALQRARDRLAVQTELSAETRARVLAEIDTAIARARGN